MAGLSAREVKDGIRYRVYWREGGRTGSREVVTFAQSALDKAERFKSLVEMCGNRWPTEDQLLAFGLGDVVRTAEDSTPEPPAIAITARPVNPSTPFADVARHYVAEQVEKGSVKGKEISNYYQRLDKHVVPYLGARPFDAITARELIGWQNILAANGLAPKTIANVRGTVVAPVFGWGCREGLDGEPPLRTSNPMPSVPMPKPEGHITEVIATEKEALIFLESLYATANRTFADMTVAMLATGTRYGEVAGMPIKARDKERGVIVIYQVAAEDENRRWYIKRMPKTKSGYREVVYPREVDAVFDDRSAGRSRDALMFINSRGDMWIYKTYEYWWNKAMKIARDNGLDRDLTPHSLRHSLLTLLARKRIDLKSLQQQAGHKNFKFTYDKYVHHLNDAADEIRAAAAPMFSRLESIRALV
ncbi:tyrosine-type recombinase/integrase [Hamadaea sp. NPDC051192]|uniref:tyrosine-type recombinase/integrase n=1 Tax=Hamadaea sp. NPDC051192 TaxID=3154940 RepID=UPI00341CCDAC